MSRRDILYSNLTHRSLCAVSVSVLSGLYNIGHGHRLANHRHVLLNHTKILPFPASTTHPSELFHGNVSLRIDAASWAASCTSRKNHSKPGKRPVKAGMS